ncbi:hypothetical protein V8E51_010792 [Hyaloscypha variabilis]
MAHADTQGLQRAPQVCSHCKSIKKGCDKKLPSCSQCIKRRAVCRYGEPEDPRRSGDRLTKSESPLGRSERLASTWTSIPRSMRAKLCPTVRLSLLLMSSLSDVLPSNFDLKASSTSATSDSVFSSQIRHIIEADGKYIDDVVVRFFQGVHAWLPIISKKRFRDRFAHFQAVPTADFALLLLLMRLITQHPSPDPETDQDREVLYLASKTVFAQVQAFIPSSLYLVQAGVILATYEHAHGMIEAAYITIGTAARMACAIGLHNKHCSMEMQGTDTWLDEEEALATWWGLMICDRIIGCDAQMHGRPLATRPIRDDDYLPLEPEFLDGSRSDMMEPTFRYFVSAISLPGVGPFGREAQATYLLDRVRMVIEAGQTSEHTLYPLGCELQNLLGTVMEQVAGRWGIYCGATQLLISALYTLHQTAAIQQDIDNNPRYRETVKVALNTMTRMVIDIAYAFNMEVSTLNMDILAPATQHIVCCAQQHILTAEDFNDRKWLEDFNQLRKMLGYFNQRWILAGEL